MPGVVAPPKKFVIGDALLPQMGQAVSNFGDNLLIIANPFIQARVTSDALPGLGAVDITAHVEKFGGECTEDEVRRLVDLAKSKKANVIVGIGGGKTLDTAKAVAFYTKKTRLDLSHHRLVRRALHGLGGDLQK